MKPVAGEIVGPVKSAVKSTVKTQGFFTWDNWPYFLAALAGLLLILLVILIIKRRRGEKKEPKPEKKKQPKGLPVRRLAKIWNKFLREIPWDLRRAVMLYQHFIVFGETGVGKSLLIDSHTDWQGHARQFYPSYTTNSLLQIYLGSKVLVQEIPAALLNDTSKNARLALTKLWKPLFRRKDPTAVIILNGTMLQTAESAYLKKQAQIIRGKINLLARIRKKPIKVRIALSHMDQIEGFLEFSLFLTQNNIPLRLEFSSKDHLKDLIKGLETYEDYLTHALNSLSADKYLKAITFMRKAPKLFKDLSRFLDILQTPDPLAPDPKLTNLSLTFRAEDIPPVSNPFTTSLTAEALKKFNPLFRHKVAAIVLGIIGIIYMGSAFIYEYRLIDDRYSEIAALEEAPPARYDENMHRLFIDTLTSMKRQTLMTFIPDFFPHISQAINQRCIENIRKFYLLPELERFSVGETGEGKTDTGHLKEIQSLKQKYVEQIEDAQDKVLYLLALIYATKDNELGNLIRENILDWSESLGLPLLLVEDYVNNNESSEGVALNIDRLYYRQKKGIADDPHTWMVYFLKVSKLYQQPIISKPEFKKLQTKTDQLLQVIREVERYDLSFKVSEILKKETPLGINVDLIARKESPLRQESIKRFLELIRKSSLKYPEVTDELSLTGLHENLKVMLHFEGVDDEKDPLFHFLFGGEEFKFSGRQWDNLLNRSRLSFFLRDFIKANRRHNGLLFFSAEKEFDDLVMNPSNDGRFFFSGHARVDGRFTKDAFQKRVEPVLTELPEFMDKLPIQIKEKRQFSDFLAMEVDAYSRQYAKAFRDYYMDFDLKVDSPGALRYVLTQLTLPSSQFMDVLLTVRDNTAIDPGENKYLLPLALRLGEFEFFQRLLEEQKGTFPELNKYRAMLKQMQMDINEDGPVEDTDEKEPLNDFKNLLTPLARISFSIFRDDPDSYLNMAKLWLESVGISAEWQDVFLAPFYQAYFLGIAEIEAEIDKTWTDLLQANISPLYIKFPFDMTSDKDVTYEEIKEATHPFGRFWKTFNVILSPFCVEQSGLWRARVCPFGAINLPENMLTTVNALSQLSALLWNNEGAEKPLEFMVKQGPLPQAGEQDPIAILSYLQVGDSSVFGFNQQPSWKKFNFKWHEDSKASVGVEVKTREEAERLQNAIAISNSPWSFYRLLQRTEDFTLFSKTYEQDQEPGDTPVSSTDKGNQLTWLIDCPQINANAETTILKIKFDLQKDPWGLFEIPR